LTNSRCIEVCLSPELLHLYEVRSRTVVVADILRATSCMVTAFAHGVETIKPFADLESCLQAAALGYETSGERNGVKVEGFDRGNSPFEYISADLRGKKIAFTTTNGTQAIDKANNARHLLIGAFLNLDSLAEKVVALEEDLLIVCAGWKGRFNLEDTLFAGALASRLKSHLRIEDDATLAAVSLYQTAKSNLQVFLEASSHVQRLNKLNIHDDMKFCLQESVYKVVPTLSKGHLVL